MDAAEILDRSAHASIAVVGDVCLDQYYFLDDRNSEISVETGLQTQAVRRFKHELGGAGNVAVNCRRLGVKQVDVYGILGDDPFAMIVKDLFRREGIGIEGLVTQRSSWHTHVYHKVYDNHTELPRFDIGNYNSAEDAVIDRLLELLQARLEGYDVVIINEQVMRGLHTPYMQQKLTWLIEHGPEIIWLTDSRNLQDAYGPTMHKLNNFEARALYEQTGPGGDEDLETIAQWLFDHWGYPLVITCGENGAIVCSSEGVSTIDGLHIIAPTDTVGAGDAFIAGLAAGLSGDADMQQAAGIGNFTAGVSIQILFETGHPNRDEVIELAGKAEYRRNPELASDVRRAVYLDNTEIEIINPDLRGRFAGSYPQVAVFDHDGTISTLRHGWESIMLEVMIHAVAGNQYELLTARQLKAIEQQSRELIEKTTGVQTIVQMQELAELVRLNGYVDESRILTPVEYKRIYNDRLMEMVTRRRDRFESGRLSIEDVTLKGSTQTLQRLRSHGVRLYLASGTDIEDVRDETAALGYASLFDGGVYGSLGDADNDPKRVVLAQIMREIEASGSNPEACIIFGDGPVEIREAKRHGIPAVGIISDERQRYGMNLEKRERLVLAGADVIIPDFTWIDQLSAWLGWGESV
jgi:sugar/nucleoside kinase (ribokinase family)/phosphoglycolate phosphatase-like HAD superfamily hydrolase